MSKIVQAVNSMISNFELISNVTRGPMGDDIFFSYKGRYVWSMTRSAEQEYLLIYYPEVTSVDTVRLGWVPEGMDMVSYSSAMIGTKEARQSFAELYSLLTERLYRINDVLDDIIADTRMS